MVQDEQFEVQRQLVTLRIELHRDAFPLIHGPQPIVLGLSLEHDLVILCLNVLQHRHRENVLLEVPVAQVKPQALSVLLLRAMESEDNQALLICHPHQTAFG